MASVLEQEQLKLMEDANQDDFNAVMDSLFDLANQLIKKRGKLTKAEETFLNAFDKYVESANDITEFEEAIGGN